MAIAFRFGCIDILCSMVSQALTNFVNDYLLYLIIVPYKLAEIKTRHAMAKKLLIFREILVMSGISLLSVS